MTESGDSVVDLAEDPIERVRRVRHDISAEFGHDVRKLGEYLMRLQEQGEHCDRLIRRSGPEKDLE